MSLLPHAPLRPSLRSAAQAAPGVRHMHASRRRADHYRTLDVPRSASLRDIKAQFYRLSKKWHPDVNRDNEGAKARFQEVSEAWATLGDERARRDYDRRLSERGSSSSSPGASSYSSYAPRGAYDESNNTARRARASYAWDYQRRQRPAAASEAYQRHGASASAWASAAAGGASQTAEQQRAAFDTMVSRNRFREQAAAARAAEAGRARPNPAQAFEEEAGGSTASAVVRFIQVAGLFTLTFWAGSKFAGGSGPVRAEGRGGSDEQWDWLEEYRQAPARMEPQPPQ